LGGPAHPHPDKGAVGKFRSDHPRLHGAKLKAGCDQQRKGSGFGHPGEERDRDHTAGNSAKRNCCRPLHHTLEPSRKAKGGYRSRQIDISGRNAEGKNSRANRRSRKATVSKGKSLVFEGPGRGSQTNSRAVERKGALGERKIQTPYSTASSLRCCPGEKTRQTTARES